MPPYANDGPLYTPGGEGVHVAGEPRPGTAGIVGQSHRVRPGADSRGCAAGASPLVGR